MYLNINFRIITYNYITDRNSYFYLNNIKYNKMLMVFLMFIMYDVVVKDKLTVNY